MRRDFPDLTDEDFRRIALGNPAETIISGDVTVLDYLKALASPKEESSTPAAPPAEPKHTRRKKKKDK